MAIEFVSYFHDPDNLFVTLLEEAKFPEELNNTVVAVSPETTLKEYDLLKKRGFRLVEGGLYGFAKVKALEAALRSNSDYYFVCDFDKMLHWLITDETEFKNIFNTKIEHDLIAISRSDSALKTYPKTWIETEEIASKIMEKIIGKYIDFMNGPYLVSKAAAKIIVENAKETGVGACAEWCLLAHLHGLEINNLPADGLTWEDPDRYQEAINESLNYEVWKTKTFDSLYEWRKRVSFLHKQVEVMIRLNQEPINPKYPFVQNKTFK